MVARDVPLYLFIGEDSFSKDAKINELKRRFLGKGLEQFNLDILYAKELSLKHLQEKILSLPLKSPKRIILIRSASELNEEIKEFILKYVTKPNPKIAILLDIIHTSPKDKFINGISRFAEVCRFKEQQEPDTFILSRQIELKKMDYALRILHRLLDNGEKPERILGGLRYAWERSIGAKPQAKRRMKLLLTCDLDIKTGRLKDYFALERLVIKLCGF